MKTDVELFELIGNEQLDILAGKAYNQYRNMVTEDSICFNELPKNVRGIWRAVAFNVLKYWINHQAEQVMELPEKRYDTSILISKEI